ncbi:MAG TPA: RlmE family RNA methyltransferase [Spirochaetales bacterium]|nr:RlmE family RNA methyltransferase [Spirochaetales bacterium]
MSSYERPDYWTIKAKKEGYPARSVFKLEEIVHKFGLLKKGSSPRILDVGAAPGSWSLWLLRNLAGRGSLLAVDLQDLAPELAARGLANNFTFFKGDILDPETRAAIAKRGPFDLVVSDAAPSTTGNRLVDQARSEELVEAVFSLALEVFAPGGSLVMKIFQGGDEKRLITQLKGHFETARGFKPEACRAESFETYLIALGFKGDFQNAAKSDQ